VATRHRICTRRDAAAFAAAVGPWAVAATAALGTGATPAGIAVDGKTRRGSRRPAVPALRAGLMLEGRVGTLDAAFTARAVAEAILAQGGPP
jgi:hypothetical protein